MDTPDIDQELLLLRACIIFYATDLYGQFYDTDMDKRREFIARLTDSFLEQLGGLLLLRDVITELNDYLDKGSPSSLRDLARTGLFNPRAARSILRQPQETLFDKDLQALDDQEKRDLRDIFRPQYIQEALILKAFLRAHEEAGRQCPLRYEGEDVTLQLSGAAAKLFRRLEEAVRTGKVPLSRIRGVFPKQS